MGVGRVNVPVRLSHPSGKTARVSYTVRPGTGSTAATAGRGFRPTSGTLTFQPGQTTKSAKVTLRSDRRDEPDESIRVLLRKARSATLATP
jgi:chitinase